MITFASMRPLLFILTLFVAMPLSAKVDFTPKVKDAYSKMLALHLKEVKNIALQEKKNDPNNLAWDYILRYDDFLNWAIQGDLDHASQLLEKISKTIDAIEDDDYNSPYTAYCVTDLYLQWAYVDALTESYFSAALKLRKARASILDNQEKYPNFLPNKKALGIMHVALGSVPENYQWIMSFFGMEGSVNKGLKMLNDLLQDSNTNPQWKWLFTESFLSYNFALINTSVDTNAIKDASIMVANLSQEKAFSQQPLWVYSAASFHHHFGKNEKALKVLNQMRYATNQQVFYYLDYMHALALLYKMDAKAATYFKKYVHEYPGKDFSKSAMHYLAWFYLLQQDPLHYGFWKNKITDSGRSFFDADKQAQKNAMKPEIPNTYLLKCRLLFDGGYYKEAERVFKINNPKHVLQTDRDKLEFSYRFGRLYDEWGKPLLAEKYYKETIEKGRNFPYYFAANSALHLGLMYEKAARYDEAKRLYESCLDMDFDEYHNGITRQAKAGLNRINKK